MTKYTSRHLLLGTALWGWGVSEAEAFATLDAYYAAGGRLIDAAVNYPIDGDPEHFGRANDIIRAWLTANPGSDLKVFCKVGSIDNMGGPETALGHADILISTELAEGKFADALFGVGIHWDDREQGDAIAESLDAMASLKRDGFQIGISGVKRPDIYAQMAPALATSWWIQVKENAATHAARDHYSAHFPDARYIAYGINMGGVKLVPAEPGSSVALRSIEEPPVAERLRAFIRSPGVMDPRPETLNHLAIMLTWANASLSGVVLGPRNVAQLNDTLQFWGRLEVGGTGPDVLAEILAERLRGDER